MPPAAIAAVTTILASLTAVTLWLANRGGSSSSTATDEPKKLPPGEPDPTPAEPPSVLPPTVPPPIRGGITINPGLPGTVPVPGSTYSTARWPNPRSIRQAFADLGYLAQSEVNNQPLNDVGPDGILGGGDDLPSSTVSLFQGEFNAVARAGLVDPSTRWRVTVDGFVGPQTLNALELVLPAPGNAVQRWQDLVGQV